MIRVARGRWRHAVMVCGKCTRKLDGGFGADGEQRLAKLLRKRAGKGKRATAGVIETRCLKLCPKNAVAVLDGARPGEWLVVPAGEPVDAVVERLGWVDREKPGHQPPVRPEEGLSVAEDPSRRTRGTR